MNVLLLGATGMVGQGVLRECLLDAAVKRVVTLGRSATGQQHQKLREIVRADLMNVQSYAPELDRFDACFFCLGVSSAGMTEERYTRVTYDLTLAVAQALAKLNPSMTFIYVSGMGTDSSERGRTMWARVKGRTENALLKLPFKAYMFRPGVIIPLHGIRSRTTWYRVLYLLSKPLLPIVKRVLPGSVTTTEQVGRAMLAVARAGYPRRILESRDIGSL
jgi:uncharacterized protein YbjT (DUF2867 family)